MRRQCTWCPWKVRTRGRIPGGFAAQIHEYIEKMTAPPETFAGTEMIMQCHETTDAAPLPCVGWMHHQLGPGQNLLLRLVVINGHYDGDLVTVGRQHTHFEDILRGTPYERSQTP